MLEIALDANDPSAIGNREDVARLLAEAAEHNTVGIDFAAMFDGSPCCRSVEWVAALARHR